MVKGIEKERLLKVMEQSMIEVPYRGHYSNTWIYEIDGEVAGCLIAYPGNKELEMERAWLDMTLDDDIRAYGSPMPMKEANDDEWYIETVATFPQYRGRGVATQLVKHVLNAYKDEKWSLNCDVTNEGALSVYKSWDLKRIVNLIYMVIYIITWFIKRIKKPRHEYMSRLNSAYLQWLTGTKMYTSESW